MIQKAVTKRPCVTRRTKANRAWSHRELVLRTRTLMIKGRSYLRTKSLLCAAMFSKRQVDAKVPAPASLAAPEIIKKERVAPIADCLKDAIRKLPLKPHQVQVVNRCMQPDVLGVLIYFTVGSGKTLAAIAACEVLMRCYTHKPIKGAVIVVPASLTANFKKELRKFRINDTRYTILSIEKFVKHQPNLDDKVLVIDEAHNLRSAEGKMSTAIRASARHAAKIILLTGTPVANFPAEIAPLLNMIAPGKIPVDRLEWKRQFGVDGTDDLSTLKKVVRKNVIYYTPTDTSNYPSLECHLTYVPMSPKQVAKHLKMAKNIKVSVKSVDSKAAKNQTLPSFFVLPRQIANGVEDEYPKFKAALKRIKIAAEKGRRSLVYSFFIKRGVDIMASLLAQEGISFALFTGCVSDVKKKHAVADYNAGKCSVLLISGAGSEGLDLKYTSYVHLMEPSWNESMTQQIVGRARRYMSHEPDHNDKRGIRIPKKVTVFRYVSVLPQEEKRPVNLSEYTGYKALLHFSADQIIAELSEKKDVIVRNFLSTLIKF